MIPKHTPEPWIARPHCESTNRHITITGANSPVAIAEIVPQTMKAYDEAAEANGRLIAASPRLLKALAELHDACLLGGLSGTHPTMVDAAVAIEDAIGEAPLTTAA